MKIVLLGGKSVQMDLSLFSERFVLFLRNNMISIWFLAWCDLGSVLVEKTLKAKTTGIQ